MKNTLLLLIALLFVNISSFAQAPEKFKYQAIITDNKDHPVRNKTIGLQISILQNDLNGTIVYQETFTEATNSSGLVNLEIGSGNTASGVFSDINWGVGPYFLGIAIDVKGGSNYINMGASQLLSVPYALFAKKAISVEGDNDTDPTNEIELPLEGGTEGQILTTDSEGNISWQTPLEASNELPETANENDLLIFDGSGWVALANPDGDATNEIQTLTLDGNVLSLTDGGEVSLSASGNFVFYYADKDEDGYGDKWNVVYADIAPEGFVSNGDDCNDFDAGINPNAAEIPEDGIDQNCDGIDIYLDEDGDGFTSDVDCNDKNNTVYPGAPEICDNTDNNCDGQRDEVCDEDGDGFTIGDGDCNDDNNTVYPGAPEFCDNRDNNCDGISDNIDPIQNVCSNAVQLSSISGDTDGQAITREGNGDKWFKITVTEDDSSIFTEDLSIICKLSVPFNVNYDLRIYSDCELNSLLGYSLNNSSSDESVSLIWDDSLGSSQSTEVYIHVVYVSGKACNNWELNILGHQ